MASFDVPKRLHAAQHATGQPDAITPASIGAAPASRFLTGTGSPEGVTAAPVGTTYTDTAATAGALEWTKFTGTGTTGWRVTKGDTGVRQVGTLLENGWATIGSNHYGVYLSRTPHLVTLDAYLDAAAATNTRFITLPAGIRPTKRTYGTFVEAGPGGRCLNIIANPDGSVESPYVLTSAFKSGFLSLRFAPAVGTWPTALPGTPA